MMLSALMLSALMLGVTPASAEPPLDVVASAVDGVYVAPGRTFDTDRLSTVVERARQNGITLLIAAPAAPEPDASAYALRLRQAADVDAAIVFGLEGEVAGSVGDDHFDGFARAEKAARAVMVEPFADPVMAADAFVTELLSEPSGNLSEVVGDVGQAVLIFVVIIVAATGAEVGLRALRSKRTEEPV